MSTLAELRNATRERHEALEGATLWRSFVEGLETTLDSAQARELACEGARSAFDQIAKWFREREVAA